MDQQKMTCRSDVRDFLIGIDYYDPDEDRGHFTIRRKVTMPELLAELQGFVEVGHGFPQFPASAMPTVAYAWDYSDQEDGDCYGEVVNELDKSIERSKNGRQHH